MKNGNMGEDSHLRGEGEIQEKGPRGGERKSKKKVGESKGHCVLASGK